MNKKRVALTNGGYFVYCTDILHRTERAVNAIMRPLIASSESVTIEDGKPLIDEAQIKKAYKIPLKEFDFDEVNDALILGQVIEWSFGEIDAETLGTIDSDSYRQIMDNINETFGGAAPLASTGEGN